MAGTVAAICSTFSCVIDLPLIVLGDWGKQIAATVQVASWGSVFFNYFMTGTVAAICFSFSCVIRL